MDNYFNHMPIIVVPSSQNLTDNTFIHSLLKRVKELRFDRSHLIINLKTAEMLQVTASLAEFKSALLKNNDEGKSLTKEDQHRRLQENGTVLRAFIKP